MNLCLRTLLGTVVHISVALSGPNKAATALVACDHWQPARLLLLTVNIYIYTVELYIAQRVIHVRAVLCG